MNAVSGCFCGQFNWSATLPLSRLLACHPCASSAAKAFLSDPVGAPPVICR